MEVFYFILRYIPFWAVPVFMISAEFTYIYWLKSIRRTSKICMVIAAIAFLFIVYYYLAGGPDGAVRVFANFIKSLK